MRAAVYRRFGGPDVVSVQDVPRPTPTAGEVLVRVVASTVSMADHRARSRIVPRGLGLLAAVGVGAVRPRHRVLGMDVAGVVEAVGDEVTGFEPGDEIIAMLGTRFGGHAEYALVPRGGTIAHKPRTMGFEDAVTLVFGGFTARGFFHRTTLGPGTTVLVNGAAGAVGTAAVQLAKAAGADVTAVCRGSDDAMVTALGADRVIDYTTTDFATGDVTYDVIVDCVGNAGFDRVGGMLAPGGALLLVVADLKGLLSAPIHARRTGTVIATSPTAGSADLVALAALADAGAFVAVRDATYDLADVVAAHSYVDQGHKKGSVVLRIAAPPAPDRLRVARSASVSSPDQTDPSGA